MTITPPHFTVHDTAQMTAVLEAAAATQRGAILLSAPGASAYLGAGWFRAALDRALAEAPGASDWTAYLDCADRAGDVMSALRAGVPGAIFTGDSQVAAKLAAMTEGRMSVLTARPESLDLAAAAEPGVVCRNILATACPCPSPDNKAVRDDD